MNQILRLILGLTLFIIGSECHSQIIVITKPTTILEIRKDVGAASLLQRSSPGDTTYLFQFRNQESTQVVDIRSMELTKSELIEFGDALQKAIDNDYETGIITPHCHIFKIKAHKMAGFYITSLKGGKSYLGENHVKKVIDFINARFKQD